MLTVKTPERRHWRSGVFIVNFEHILHLVLVGFFSILNFEHVTAGWVSHRLLLIQVTML